METKRPADPAAFFDAFYPQVYRFVASATGAPAPDVEDLVQETLLEAWKGRERFRGDSELLTWILAIAKNRVRMRLRAEGRREDRERARRALAAIESELVPEDLLQAAEVVRVVRQALDEIEAPYADVLIRRYYDGLSVREIAEAAGESEKSVESRLHRAREAIRERLKNGANDGSR